jgi:predicted component of viral defense system (DUF524 family)
MDKIVRLPLSEFFEHVRSNLGKADIAARAAYDAVIATRSKNATKAEEEANKFAAFLAAREVQLAAHERLSKLLTEHYLPSEVEHGRDRCTCT